MLSPQALGVRPMHRFENGGVVQTPSPTAPEPSRLSKLYDLLMGRKALQQAAAVGNAAPPQVPVNQNIDVVRKAAQEAATRMEAAKAANGGVVPRQF